MGFLAKGKSLAEAQSQKWLCSQHITENCLIRRQYSETGGYRLSSQVGRAQGLKSQTEGLRMVLLMLISSFIPLWSEKIFGIILIFLNLL